MKTVNLQGQRKMLEQSKKFRQRMKGEITYAYRYMLEQILKDVVTKTPQFSGNLVMHWSFEYTGQPALPSSNMGKDVGRLDEPFQAGEPTTVKSVLARERAKIANIKYNTNVKLVNNVYYAEAVQDGKGPRGRVIRDENRFYEEAYAPSTGVIMVKYLENKYSDPAVLKAVATRAQRNFRR